MSALQVNGHKIDISYVYHETTVGRIRQHLNSRTLHTNEELIKVMQSIQALHPKIRSPQAKNTLASLYGQVENLKVNNQVDSIVEKSFSLLAKKEQTSQETMALKIGEIESELARICYENALSRTNRGFMRLAIYNLGILQVFSSSKTANMLQSGAQVVRKNRDMFSKPNLSPSFVDAEKWESAEFALELCEIAHFFYQNKISEGMKKLHQLTPSQKNRLEELCIAAGAESPNYFLKGCVDIKECQNNLLHFVQALVGYAHEVAQGQPLMISPSEKEIHMMFREVESLESGA